MTRSLPSRSLGREAFAPSLHMPMARVQPYIIRKPWPDDLAFYRTCLSDPLWRTAYNVPAQKDLADYMQQFALTEYPDVQRYVVLRRTKPIGFFHLEKSSAMRCTLAGGIAPEAMGSGEGVSVAVIALDVIFSQLHCQQTICKVMAHNQPSQRMLIALGFTREGVAGVHDFADRADAKLEAQYFGLLATNYPNPFVQKRLRKLSYEPA